ncbi:hypothetical protein WwAna1092 [Wolbachia endosymbiont of Drosophila ananassae]|nr:hypothetical protein WwAna1092 [Wolbachia endosymbiont of Drosophila ananassae]
MSITIRVSNNAHNDTKTPNMDRNPSLLIMPSEIELCQLQEGSE